MRRQSSKRWSPVVCAIGLAGGLLASPAWAVAQVPATVRVLRASAVLEQPLSTSPAVGTANPGDVLEVLDQRDDWWLVRPPAGSAAPWRTGWINRTSVEPMATPRGAPVPSVTADQGPTLAHRKGFIVGIGGGGAMHRAPVFRYLPGSPTNNSFGIVTDFRIGYAPTDELLIYYNNQVTWSRNELYDIVGLTGVGVTYMFRKTSPGPFVTGAIGRGIAAEVDFSTGRVGSNDSGTAFSIGGGWEFTRHWSVEGGAMFVRLGVGNNHTVLKGTIHWMFY